MEREWGMISAKTPRRSSLQREWGRKMRAEEEYVFFSRLWISDNIWGRHSFSKVRQSSNPVVCGFSMMGQVRLCSVWPTERLALPWTMGLEDYLNMLLSCFRRRTSDLGPDGRARKWCSYLSDYVNESPRGTSNDAPQTLAGMSMPLPSFLRSPSKWFSGTVFEW